METSCPTHILYVDDDTEMTSLLDEYLSSEGFSLTLCHDGESGLEQAISGKSFDVVLLDLMLPKLNGFDVLKAIRQSSTIPIILLTAKSDEFDRVLGLELGADDYLSKPFSTRELLARIKALLRRMKFNQYGNTVASMDIGPMMFDCRAHQLFFNDQFVNLTGTEYSLLQLLALQKGQRVAKASISLKLFGKPLESYDRSIDMHISNIRRKLAKYTEIEIIRTIRPQAYMLIDHWD
ncbi:response regulator [Ningiella sp. W23]|uniref:response regulator n=1 Tax=Ningiella sp. W23 TaxID=3023715 RepID=UPI003756EF19